MDSEMDTSDFIDYYAVLMISPQADRAMIEWAARLLLTRYGERNALTADPEKYALAKTAYRTLVDPQRKPAYDQNWSERADVQRALIGEPSDSVCDSRTAVILSRERRLRPEQIKVEFTATADDARVQRRLRQAVLSILYEVMIINPRNPELGRAQIARKIGCRVDDLEFSMWYLREKELLKTSNSGLYAITSAGADWVESGGVPHLSEPESTVGAGENLMSRRVSLALLQSDAASGSPRAATR